MGPVVVRTTQKDDDSDRFTLLEQILDEACFWEIMEKAFVESCKSKDDFLIAIKPNLMMYYSKDTKDDMCIITEPVLVEHLINKIAEKGFVNIALVESQNVFGNWFKNREVENVAKEAGYIPTNYHIVDLTLNVVSHVYKGSLGTYFVGKTWKDADFRISFAKNKTHISCYYTLTIKNIYGTLPEQNKFREYHADREIDTVTIETIQEFPVNFGIVDGIWSADGIFGVKSDYSPNHTKTLIAGENIISVDIVGGQKMGINPMNNRFVKLAIETFGMPEINIIGDKSHYKNWKNITPFADKILDYGEELYGAANILGYLSSDMDTRAFPEKNIEIISWYTKIVRYVFINISRVLNKAGII
jgi:uncharacterized protein (DUF362 family)